MLFWSHCLCHDAVFSKAAPFFLLDALFVVFRLHYFCVGQNDPKQNRGQGLRCVEGFACLVGHIMFV